MSNQVATQVNNFIQTDFPSDNFPMKAGVLQLIPLSVFL